MFTYTDWKFWQRRIQASINSIATILLCIKNLDPFCNEILQQIMKCSDIQRENFKRGHVASIYNIIMFKTVSVDMT